ncbi:unnamed protein product [Calicophoron daubneyi]|uniref:UDENN domain-containing protein n=1 Tax=Calicophoron daubneyi TaxID=300641 RepID=A0AAV2TKI2_CALDB
MGRSYTCLLHIFAVGFHHRRGATVELVYPPLNGAADADIMSDDDEVINLPNKWGNLPSLALPDGAHNYQKDSIYFTLPSLEKEDVAVFGIASYRQVDSLAYLQANPEVTRNTVQKSLVVLSRFPLFSFIAHHLSRVAESLFLSGGFTLENLVQAYGELETTASSALLTPTVYQDALYFNLSAANFVRVYGRDALTLFKLILLERRILFDGESAGYLCNWIITLLSLFPDTLANGFSSCAFIDPTWLSDRSCWSSVPRSIPPQNAAQGKESDNLHTSRSYQDLLSSHQSDQSAPSENRVPETNGLKLTESDKIIYREKTEQTSALMSVTSTEEMPIADTGATSVHLRPKCQQDTSDQRANESPCHSDLTADSSFTAIPHILDTVDSPFLTDNWGFPLALFTKSYIVPLYAPLGFLDTLLEETSCKLLKLSENSFVSQTTERCVRSFLAGATNPLLRTHRELADVIVASLSPTEGLTDSTACQSSALTQLFDETVKAAPIESRIVSASGGEECSSLTAQDKLVVAQGTKAASIHTKRPSQIIRICQSSNHTCSGLRSTPAPLSQALQLTRLDRLFMDHLHRTVSLWYEAKAALLDLAKLPPSSSITELLSQEDQSLLDRLSLSQKTVLLQFPSDAILDTWIRQQFVTYLHAVLLTAEGYNETEGDFGSSFVTCLRSSRCFLIWRNQFVPGKIFTVSSPHQTIVPSSSITTTATETIRPVSVSDPQNVHPTELLASPTVTNRPAALSIFMDPSEHNQSQPTASLASILAQHPGRRMSESDDWGQFVDGVKRFGNMAADLGRRLGTQGMSGFNRLSGGVNSNFRSGFSSSNVISKFSDAFRSLLSSSGTGGSANR